MEPIGAAYTLTAAQFAGQVNQRGGNVAVRRAQVDCVLVSFEEAKKYMSKDGIEEVHKYLRTGEWVRDQTNAGSHPAYKRFVGSGGYKKTLHYPKFFVIQAIYTLNGRQIGDAVERMYEELSGHWGKFIPSDKPFYPRLADPDQERLLIMGDYRWRDFQVGRQASNNTIHVARSAQRLPAKKCGPTATVSIILQPRARGRLQDPKSSGPWALGQQQSNKVLNLLSDPIEEFSAAAESSGLAVHDGQRTNKRAREN
ncbi:hypothetical protein ACJA88_008961 [Fusarium oxysporum]